MNQIKWLYLIPALFLIVQTAKCQNSKYIATDSIMKSGVKLIKGTAQENSHFIKVVERGDTTTYFPNQLTEYETRSGARYYAKEIVFYGKKKRVFLETLERGNISLYYYESEFEKTFFIEKDTILTELKRGLKAFKQLSRDCEFIDEVLENSSYSRRSLIKLVSKYNKCDGKPITYLKSGLSVGIRNLKIIKPDTYINIATNAIQNLSFNKTGSISIGVNVQIPIEMGDFSFNSGFLIYKIEFSEVEVTSRHTTIVAVNLNSINIPGFVRYTFPRSGLRPFLELGAQMNYHIKNDANVYRTDNRGNLELISQPEQLFSELNFGHMVGFGCEFQISSRNSISFTYRRGAILGRNGTLDLKNSDVLLNYTF